MHRVTRTNLSRRSGCRAQRGAVLLLSAFTTSVMMLALVTALFTRTMVEMRAAERFRDGQQAFYLAEGALDAALAESPGFSETELARLLGSGSSTYEIRTLSVELIPPNTERITRQIVARGAARANSDEVTAIVVEEREGAAGAYATGPIIMAGKMAVDRAVALRTAAGHVGAIQFVGPFQMTGPISVGEPAPMEPTPFYRGDFPIWIGDGAPYEELVQPPLEYLYGRARNPDGFAILNHPEWERFVGSATFAQAPTVAPLEIHPWSDIGPPEVILTPGDQRLLRAWDSLLERTPASRRKDVKAQRDQFIQQQFKARCGEGLQLAEGEHRTVADGDPLDLTPPNDGEIILCQDWVTLDQHAELAFEAPATVYLNGPSTMVDTYPSYAAVYSQRSDSRISAPGELQLVAPGWVEPGPIVVKGGHFEGAIWAPHSSVQLETLERYSMSGETDLPISLNPTRIIARSIYMENMTNDQEQFTFRQQANSNEGGSSGTAESEVPSTMRYWEHSSFKYFSSPTQSTAQPTRQTCGSGKFAVACW